MFESVKYDRQVNARTYFASWLLSVLTHAGILLSMVSLPLIFCSPLSPVNPVTWIIDSPILTGKVPPPPPPAPSRHSGGEGSEPEIIAYEESFEPPKKMRSGIPAPVELPEIAGTRGPWQRGEWNGPGINPNEPGDRSWIETLIDKPPAILPPLEPLRKPDVVQVVSKVQESKLLYKVNPVYPELAARARVSGTVVLAAIIDVDGNVTNLKVLSGHPLLTGAAVEAVSQWKYRPTILNGEPVSVSAVVTVVFRID